MEAFLDQLMKDLPFGVGIALLVFLGILLILWLLLPLWVLFIQWNTAKIRDEIRRLSDLMEEGAWDAQRKPLSGPKD